MRSPFRPLAGVVARVELVVAYDPSPLAGIALACPAVREALLDAAECCPPSDGRLAALRGVDGAGSTEWWTGVLLNASTLGAPSQRPLSSAAAAAVGDVTDDHAAHDAASKEE